MYTQYDYNNELYHYGIKGMKWGVRKDPGVVSARQNYKQAKKAYNKAFNKWYWRMPGVTAKKRHENQYKYADALSKAGDLGVAKGKLIEAKGKASGNSKKIAKGKYVAQRASITKAYNTKVRDLVGEGYTYNESILKTIPQRNEAIKKQQDLNATYRKNKIKY